ncbi:MAG: DNA polymerase III subunit delta [Eggerthellaceae bacterium]|nr:DNA polymerase III subunit delta [Eggerthellaceae bacterium]
MTSRPAHSLLPAYLVTGTDELKRQTVVKRLRDRLSAEGDLSMNMDTFAGDTAEGADIVAACNTLPFLSEHRLVQVDAADKLKKADQDLVIAYLASANPSTVLCLVTTGLAKNTRLYKAVKKLGDAAIVECAPPKRRDLPALVRSMAMAHGATITPSGANLLVDLVGENTVELDAQLQKLALAHRGEDPITDNEVASMVGRTSEAKPWEFVDAFCTRNIKKALAVESHLGDKSVFGVFSMTITRIRELMIAQSLLERGSIGQLPEILHVPSWRVKNHARWARAFTKQELHEALKSARDTEQAMKSGSDPHIAFQQWWLSVLSGRPLHR